MFLRQCLKMREDKKVADWMIASVRSLIGAALVGQKKYQTAEPLLLQSYEGFRKDADKLPPAVLQERLIETMGWLVQLYDACDKKDEATAWRKKLDQAKAATKKP